MATTRREKEIERYLERKTFHTIPSDKPNALLTLTYRFEEFRWCMNWWVGEQKHTYSTSKGKHCVGNNIASIFVMCMCASDMCVSWSTCVCVCSEIFVCERECKCVKNPNFLHFHTYFQLHPWSHHRCGRCCRRCSHCNKHNDENLQRERRIWYKHHRNKFDANVIKSSLWSNGIKINRGYIEWLLDTQCLGIPSN